MTLTNYDFRTTHFEIKAPTKISKQPDFESLTTLYDEIKRCAQNVPSNNGGGNYGHLGLVVTATDYQLVSINPFIRPQNPGEFAIPAHPQGGNYTADEIKVMKDMHDDNVREYEKVNQVEAALKQFIVEAIQEDYLLDLRNTLTGKLEGSIVYIMTQLFATYAKITAQSVLEKQLALVNTTYDPSTPISKIFAKAQNYQKYASAFGDTVTGNHLITICYNIFRKTGKFNSALQKWNEKTPTDKTWDNFKQHFREASIVLKEFDGTTTGDAGYANQIATDVTNNLANLLQNHQHSPEEQQAATDFMMNMSNAANYNQQVLPQLFSNMAQMNEKITNMQNSMNALSLANAARNNNNQNNQQRQNPPPQQFPPVQQQFQQGPPPNTMFQQMPFCPPTNQQYMLPPMMQGFQNQQQNNNNRNNNRNNNNRNFNFNGGAQFGQQNFNGNTNRQGPPKQKYYCWSHGVCNHPGINCRTPNQGHQPYATFQNPMGGTMKGAGKYLNNY